jgi:hypothetical protein
VFGVPQYSVPVVQVEPVCPVLALAREFRTRLSCTVQHKSPSARRSVCPVRFREFLGPPLIPKGLRIPAFRLSPALSNPKFQLFVQFPVPRHFDLELPDRPPTPNRILPPASQHRVVPTGLPHSLEPIGALGFGVLERSLLTQGASGTNQ